MPSATSRVDTKMSGATGAPIQRYRFPQQDTDLRPRDKLCMEGGADLGRIEAISYEDRTIDIKKQMDTASLHSKAIFEHDVVGTDEQAGALVRLGMYVAENGVEGAGPYQAARDLLVRRPPNVSPARLPGETALAAATRLAPQLLSGVLPIQGPPGAGKTYTAAHMICELVRARKKVGVTANSHKVIRNLLDEVVKAADDLNVDVSCIQKPADTEQDVPGIRFARKNEDVFAALGVSCQVAGGTSWLWAREEAFESVDVLFVDEAAQMSFANVLAVAQACRQSFSWGIRSSWSNRRRAATRRERMCQPCITCSRESQPLNQSRVSSSKRLGGCTPPFAASRPSSSMRASYDPGPASSAKRSVLARTRMAPARDSLRWHTTATKLSPRGSGSDSCARG